MNLNLLAIIILPKKAKATHGIMLKRIVAFHQDDINDWVADLECGHTQHVRHNPPWQNRPWVTSTDERNKYLGHQLDCKDCETN